MFLSEIVGIYNTGKDENDDDYIKIGDVKTFAGMELGMNNDTNGVVGVIMGGSYDKDAHDIYLNDLYINENTEYEDPIVEGKVYTAGGNIEKERQN